MTDSFFACEDPSTWLYQIKLKKAVSRALSKVQHYRITCFVTHFPGPNSTPAKFANVWQIQLSWITVVKFDTASGVHFSVTFLVLPSSSWLLKVPNHARLANTRVVSRWIRHIGLSSAEIPAGYPNKNSNNGKNRKRAGHDPSHPIFLSSLPILREHSDFSAQVSSFTRRFSRRVKLENWAKKTGCSRR